IQANFDESLTNKCYAIAIYLVNRTPTRKLGWKTPIEAATGKRPFIGYLRPIGSRAYVLNARVVKGAKMASRSIVGKLIGYDSTNIYRVWILSRLKIIRARDIWF
ncbi:hypothetical protein BDV96DRAFT_467977, partial [Lophiotrema nucula]